MNINLFLVCRDTDDYNPSHVPGGPAALRTKTKKKVAKLVDSSKINRNEIDQAQRIAIHKDQVEYENRKGLGPELEEVLSNLNVFEDRRYLSDKVICNFLLDQWWDLRFSPGRRPIYLAFGEVQQIDRDIARGVTNFDLSFAQGSFGGLYRSVVPWAKKKQVCFFLHRNQNAMASGEGNGLESPNHFFPVVFDYRAKKVHCFGVVSVEEPEVTVASGRDSSWDRWMGPKLWMAIGKELGWEEDVGDPDEVVVVIKNWCQVS